MRQALLVSALVFLLFAALVKGQSIMARFGPGSSAHGSSDMPTWGPIFQTIDGKSDPAVQDRIRNLVDYLALLQRK
jgi:hypothetical protein